MEHPVSDEGFLAGLPSMDFSNGQEGEIVSLWSLLRRVLISFLRASPSWSTYLPGMLPVNTCNTRV
jgi:hypothetical protein